MAHYAKRGMGNEVKGLSPAERQAWDDLTGKKREKGKDVMPGRREPVAKAGKRRPEQSNKYENLWDKLGESARPRSKDHDWGSAPSLQQTAMAIIDRRRAERAKAEQARRRAEQTQRILARQAAARMAPARRPVRG